MDYVLYCRIRQFYINLLSLPVDRPCTVIRDNRVLDSNQLATKRGVVYGMPLTQARTILREEGIFRNLRAEEGEAQQKQWLELATDFTGVIEPEDRHSGYLDLSAHPKPADVAVHFLEQLERLTGTETIFGAGASRWLAKLSADLDGGRLTPLDADGLAEISVLHLSPVAVEYRERLRFLGYHSVHQLSDLPTSTLRGQFGDEGLRIQLAAKGSLKDPVQAIYPPDTLNEKLIFDGICTDSLMLDAALIQIGNRIGNRLLTKEQQATEAHLTLEQEEGNVQRFKRRFNKPLRCPRSAIAALRLLLTQGAPDKIVSIGINLPKLEHARNEQQSFTGVISTTESSDRAESALRQVRSVFGEQSIQLAGKIALPRRQRVLQEWKNATGWR